MNPLSLIPTTWLWPAAAVVGAALLGTVGVQTLRLDHALRHVAEIQAAWSADRERAAEIARKAEADARAEEQRRIAAQKEITDELDRKLQAARADAAIADAAAGRLSERVAALVAAARQAARDPGAAGASASAGDPIGVLADVLGRADARAGVLARVADERGAAGAACERSYDALTRKASTDD